MDDCATSIVGLGFYTVPEAARIIDASSNEVRRWLYGYESRYASGTRYRVPPLWQRQFDQEDIDGLGFLDLLELRLVKAFRSHYVSLQAIRAAAAYARQSFSVSHPFTCKQFLTDGRGVFSYVLNETGDESLVDMVKRQNVFNEVVGPSLYAGIQFSSHGEAQRWFPMDRNRHVVIDPAIAFGSPTLASSGITTLAVARSYAAENEDASRVASLFEITRKDVGYAVKYEKFLAA
jgi:uncharacterized protein (DUF433 family)